MTIFHSIIISFGEYQMIRKGTIIPALLLVMAGFLFAETATDPSLRRYTTPAGLQELIETEETSYLLVDVRTPAEYAEGHIPTAINVPYQKVASELPETSEDTIVILYCRSGRRSGIAYDSLRSNGYERLVDFGGIVRRRGELER